MFFFRKKESKPLDLSWLGTDMHSHMIPGIDDGSPDMATTLEMLSGLSALGYKKIITTPHVLWDLYPNTPAVILGGVEEVRAAVRKAGIPLGVHAAAEYFMDDHFAAELKNKAPLLPISGNLVLVEYSMITAPYDLQETLFAMQLQNYQPVIAHPERYTYLSTRKNVFDELKDAGCYLQLNLLSLTGYYGKGVQDLAEYLVKKNYYDLAGTDMHHPKHLAALQKLATAPVFQKLRDSGLLKNHTL